MIKKKIALFGASGQTGILFLEQALASGYSVNALVRKPGKIGQKSENLKIVQGDILIQEDVEKIVEGTDIVVSLFGHVKGSPDLLQTNGSKNIILAMKKFKVGRIISLSGGGLPFPEYDQPKFIDLFIRRLMKITVPGILIDASKHYDVLRSSGLKWEIIRVPKLTNGALTRKYRVGWVGVNAGIKISRADLAHFLLNQVEDESFNLKMPFVSY